MSEDNNIGRRGFLAGGAATFSLVLLPGCIPFFALILRGGALRAFSSGARLGGAASIATLGRGMGIAGRGATASRIPVGKTPVRIVSADGRELATSSAQGSATTLIRGNQRIFRSNANASDQKDVGRLDHVDFNGNNVGRSIFRNNEMVEHFGKARGLRERRIGYDVVLRSARLIRHFDQNENEIGETELQHNGNYADVVADDETDRYLTSLQERDERCPEVVAQRSRYNYTAEQCTAGSEAACARQNVEWRRLGALEQSCK